MMFQYLIVFVLINSVLINCSFATNGDSSQEIETPSNGRHLIEGKISLMSELLLTPDWFASTRVIVNYGERLGFLKKDGSFEITNLPPGSYLVEVTNPDYLFEPVRVDINSKGKMRARKVNYIQTSSVHQLPYPLKLKPKSAYKYFQIRETWKLTDFIFNPMVLMMVLPLFLLLVLPKMMNAADPETQREMQNMQMPKYDMPELSEVMANLFTGGKKPNSQINSGASGSGSKMKTIKKKQ